ncbi:MAG: hypothetical protein ACI3VA_08720 [Candidatus Limivicinus sp.]
MTLGTAALLLAAAVVGLVLTCKTLRERRALRVACIVLLSLIALVLAGYIGLTALFVDAVRNQPLAP